MATALRRDPIVQLGEFLRAARERAGLTLQQVSNTTKIPQRHLDAIEHGDITVVPKGPYRRGEVRAFAEAVGVDEKLALAKLEDALPEAPTPQIAVPVEPVEPRSSWAAALMLLAAVAALLVLAMWNREPGPAIPLTPDPTPPAATAPTPHVDSGADAVLPPPTIVAAPADQPASAPVNPLLVVTSDPPGARVVVDGIGRGTTPATIQLPALGQHGVRVVRDGYVGVERTVNLTAKRPAATLRVELRPAQ